VLDEEALKTELEVVKNERRLRVENDPEGIIEETVMREVFGTHPYGRPVLGTMQDLESIKLDDCIAFYRTYYSPSNATIAVVGDAKTEDVLTLVAQKYGSLVKSEVPKETQVQKAPVVSKTVEIAVPIATEKIILAFRGVEVSHPDSYALDCLNHILFDDESSRVYRELVEEKKVASSVDGAVEQFQGDGIISVEVVMNTGRKAEEALDLVMAKINEVTEEGVTDRELERAKNFLEASFYKAMTTMGSRATQLALHHIMLGHYLRLNEYVPNIERVTKEDVQRAAKTYLDKERLVMVIARPKK
jgi:zinc protease